MVRLQKRFAYKYKDKEHYKHIITIPQDTIEALGWKEGEELTTRAENERLVLLPSKETQSGASTKRRKKYEPRE